MSNYPTFLEVIGSYHIKRESESGETPRWMDVQFVGKTERIRYVEIRCYACGRALFREVGIDPRKVHSADVCPKGSTLK